MGTGAVKPEAIEWAREKLGLSQAGLARALNRHRTTVAYWESGRNPADTAIGFAIAGLFVAHMRLDLAQEWLFNQGSLLEEIEVPEEAQDRAG